MNIFKKISLFWNYRRAIIDSKTILSERFNIRVDGAQRLYTVINIPEELVGESYSLITSDINRISETMLEDIMKNFQNF